MNSRLMMLAAIAALSSGYEVGDKSTLKKPKARDERAPSQVEDLKRKAQEKRDRRAAKLSVASNN